MSFIDARRLDAAQTANAIEGDLCIIGAGAAGITLARRYIGRGERVILLESGGLEPDAATQALNEGTIVGQNHAPLDSCRLRGLGGTTQHWTAHLRRLDPLDFATRPWIAHSGWPMGADHLARYYERAERIMGLPTQPYLSSRWLKDSSSPMQDSEVELQLRHIADERFRRFGKRFRDELGAADNIHCYLFANVLGIDTSPAADRVTGLRVGTLSGVRFRVRARRYVLACGGIENARLLLLSGFDRHDLPGRKLVGAFFANHPVAIAGYIQPTHKIDMRFIQRQSHAHGRIAPLWALGESAQRRLHLPGCWLQPAPVRDAKQVYQIAQKHSLRPLQQITTPSDEQVARLAAELDGRPLGSRRLPLPWLLRVFIEPTPNPDSRVNLGKSSDALGQRRVELDWVIPETDSIALRRILTLIGGTTAEKGIGRFRDLFPDTGLATAKTVATHHHMGTTRMHSDPSQGVVDADCRVHGTDNLFIAGSSVFPTYGTVNSTLTIIALAERLADALQAEGRPS